MSTVAAPRAHPRTRGVPRPSAGALGLGVATLWLSIIVLLPLAAVVARSLDGGLAEFWESVSSRQSVAALRFTLLTSLGVAAIDAVMGTLIAWVLVRDRFRGKSFVNALIERGQIVWVRPEQVREFA